MNEDVCIYVHKSCVMCGNVADVMLPFDSECFIFRLKNYRWQIVLRVCEACLTNKLIPEIENKVSEYKKNQVLRFPHELMNQPNQASDRLQKEFIDPVIRRQDREREERVRTALLETQPELFNAATELVDKLEGEAGWEIIFLDRIKAAIAKVDEANR